MAHSLPARPNLDHLRAQAKRLLADLRDGKASAVRTFITHLPAARRMTADGVRRAGLRLADAQSAIARQSGFDNWPSLARHVEQLRSLEGRWAFHSLEVDGLKMAAAMLGSSTLLIDGDRFRMESAEATYEGVFTIDVEPDPSCIDIEFVAGPEAGNWSYGIYRLDGDDLTFCLGLTGAPRPTRFATAPNTGHALERLRRVSTARPEDVRGGKPTAAGTVPAQGATVPDDSAFACELTPLLRRLQGDWVPVTLVSGGEPLAVALLSHGSRTTTGNEAKVTFGGQTMVHVKMRFDESVTPVAVDYLNVGRGPKTISLGIFEWVDGGARFCMAQPGAPRPTDFSSMAGSGRTLSQWRKRPTP